MKNQFEGGAFSCRPDCHGLNALNRYQYSATTVFRSLDTQTKTLRKIETGNSWNGNLIFGDTT